MTATTRPTARTGMILVAIGTVGLAVMLWWDANGAPTVAHFLTASFGYLIGQGIVTFYAARRRPR
ncbi:MULTISPECIES: hypothetical protein [Microbacterium]|uniref:hypothetical protein n=1 Tax=Microbacterium TaxID=33882 RepID=UPI000734B143|nr:hypothetical protein [Microbacterium testaceum]KTS02562.1 hypothetical protein NS283_14350 [Microbacterium testaceum]